MSRTISGRRLVIEVDICCGAIIEPACADAVDIANTTKFPVVFTFNGTPVRVEPGDGWVEVVHRWNAKLTADQVARGIVSPA